MDIEITINKQQVYNEVQRLSEYVGAKNTEDKTAYDRVRAVDEDRTLFENYWSEACSKTMDATKEFLTSASGNTPVASPATSLGTNFVMELTMPSNYDTALTEAATNSLANYFVNYILSRWFVITSKGESQMYGLQADIHLKDVIKKIYYRTKPTRTIPT